MISLQIEEKNVQIFPSKNAIAPIIYLNNYTDDGTNIYEAARVAGCPDFTLVTIGNMKWNEDMTPWSMPPITARDVPFSGGADDYIRLLTDK